MSLEELTVEYASELRAAGYNGDEVVASSPRKKPRPKTNSLEAFESFANLRGASEVLSTLDTFTRLSELDQQNDFAVSCLPGSKNSSNEVRACGISMGMVMVFAIAIRVTEGGISNVSIYGEPDEDLGWTRAWPSIQWQASYLDGGGIKLAIPREALSSVFSAPEMQQMVARRVAAIRSRKKRYRRKDWHNPWLWSYIDTAAGQPVQENQPPEVWDVSAKDAIREARQRRSQRRFRQLLLQTHKPECAICGIDRAELLDAAHIKPHSEGGSASSDNGRLLCANHHRAFDAELFKWTGSRFEWIGHGAEPNLGGTRTVG